MALKFLQHENEWYVNSIKYFLGNAPVFMARIGGSDTEAAVAYYQSKITGVPQSPESMLHYKHMVARFNGYYDFTESNELYIRYCEILLKCYHDATQMVFCNYQLLSLHFKNWIHPQFYRDNFENKEAYDALVRGLHESSHETECYPYPFIERVVFDSWTMFRSFSRILPGKKVLVVSPFAESIESNFHNRERFFKSYAYPDFTLVTYNTPITYSGLPDELYPDGSWHESLDRMKREIAERNFDIALLSCGSYALPLGEFIAKECGKHAIYVGGVLQLYFGIMGRRYDNPFFLDQINPNFFIPPLEGKKYLRHANIEEGTAREALGAYF
jgi:hypothetical protein